MRGLNREGGLIKFLPLKSVGLFEGGGLFERGRGGANKGLRYLFYGEISKKFFRFATLEMRRGLEPNLSGNRPFYRYGGHIE